jgi:seryl-tRNA synthetase
LLSLQLIREQPDLVRDAMRRRHEDAPVDEIIQLDEQRRRLLVEVEALRGRRNEVSREIGRLKGDPAAVDRIRGEMRAVGDQIAAIEQSLSEAEAALNARLLELPNIPDASVPDGDSEDDNVVVAQHGEPARYDFVPKAHWDLAPRLGIIDFERGVKLSGTRFYVLKGAGARLQRALIQFLLDLHVEEHGYTEMNVPYLLRREPLQGSGQLPRFADNLYHDAESDLWLIPTAEVALANLYAGEILEPGTLPLSMASYTACFRKEQFASGKDTRGIKRGHQFDKVEMFKIVEPGQDEAALDEMVEHAGDCLRRLGLAYRVKLLCTADLGFQSAKTYDLDAWAPGCQEWLEVSSCSTVKEFQARRAGLRYRREAGGRPEFPHELNGSGLGVPRTMIALMETYQQGDGSIVVPDVLRQYMGGLEVITATADPQAVPT